MGIISSVSDLLNHPKFKDLISGSEKVAEGVRKLSPFFNFAFPGSGNLIALAADAVGGITDVLSSITDEKLFSQISTEERIEVAFMLICHKAYTESMLDALKNLSSAAIKNKKLLKAFDAKPSSKVKEANKSSLPLQNMHVIFSYSILETKNLTLELFDAYSLALADRLSSQQAEADDVKEIVTAIESNAYKKLQLMLCEKGDGNEWIYNWININILRHHDALLHELKEDFSSLLRSLDKSENEIEDNEWKKYRRYLKESIEDPLFGSDLCIKDIFVPQLHSYYCVNHKSSVRSRKPELPVLDDTTETLQIGTGSDLNILTTIAHIIQRTNEHRHICFVFGGPGAGKTSFAKMFCAWLADIKEYTPLYIALQSINPKNNFLCEVENYLSNHFSKSSITNLPFVKNKLFILDGFDELAQATRQSMGEFFQQIRSAQINSKYRHSFFLITGRHTLFERDDSLLPEGSHIFTLLPFNYSQIQRWSSNWNEIARKQSRKEFDGTLFWNEYDEDNRELHELSTQPMLLYLLALLNESSRNINIERMKKSKSEVYKEIVDWICDRHHELRGQKKGITLSKDSLRMFLQIAGFCTHAYNRRDVHITELQHLLDKCGIDNHAIEKRENYESQQTFLNFSFRKVGESAWEFKHKSFGEYLAAEYIFIGLNELYDMFNNIKISGTEIENAISEKWNWMFSPAFMTNEVEAFLKQMVIDISHKKKDFLPIMHDICDMMYSRFCDEQDFAQSFLPLSNRYNVKPTMIHANLGASILHMGALFSNILDESVYFEPEKISPGSWANTYTVISKWFDMKVNARRLFHGVSLSSDEGIIIKCNDGIGMILDYIKLDNIQKANFSNASFCNSDLSGLKARNIKFTSANFERSVLNYAYLRNSEFSDTNFIGSVICDANCSDCSFVRADFSKSTLNNSKFTRSDFTESKLCEAHAANADFRNSTMSGADFKSADMDESDFSEVDLSDALMSDASLKGADFTGALLEGTEFVNSDLSYAKFVDCDLSAADLAGANVHNARFLNVNLTGVCLEDVNMNDVAEFDGVYRSDDDLKEITDDEKNDIDDDDLHEIDYDMEHEDRMDDLKEVGDESDDDGNEYSF